MNLFRTALSLFMALFLFFPVSGQILTVTLKKDKYGYADETGKFVIKAQFDQAYPFSNGRAKVRKGDKWGYINTEGKVIIPIQYENIEEFTNGIARVKKGKKYGYIKEDGKVYIKPDYDFIGSFNEDGYIWVAKGKSLQEARKGLYHYDEMIVQPKYSYVGFYVTTDSVDYTNGSPVSSQYGIPENNEIRSNFCRLSCSSYPYIWINRIAGYMGILDLAGKTVVKEVNGAIGMPREGFCLKRKYSKKGDKQYYSFNYLTTDGKSRSLFKKDVRQLVDPDNIFEGCTPFNNGYAMCTSEDMSYLINPLGGIMSPSYHQLQKIGAFGYITTKNGRFGLLSENGKEVVAPSFKKLSAANTDCSVLIAQDGNTSRFGFIAPDGSQVIPFNYDDATAYINGLAYVKEGLYYGIVDAQCNYLVKNRWEAIIPAVTGNYVWVKSPQTLKWHSLDIQSDNLTFDKGFDNVTAFDEKNRAFVMTDGKFGALRHDETNILPFSFDNLTTARAAMQLLDSENRENMKEIEAYRFNIYHHPELHKYRLHQQIPSNMWDY